MAGLTFNFSPGEVAEINKPVKGRGGFQSLMKLLQQKVAGGGAVTFTDAEVGKLVRYMSYRPGGFEGRLAAAMRRELHGFIG
jgi:hypothetical protein